MRETVRATATFRGRVQGVGFRYTTVRVAAGFAVTGWVRNERDGSVTAVAEGARAEVDAFLAALQDRMGGYIRDAQVGWGRPAGEFADFSVAFSR